MYCFGFSVGFLANDVISWLTIFYPVGWFFYHGSISCRVKFIRAPSTKLPLFQIAMLRGAVIDSVFFFRFDFRRPPIPDKTRAELTPPNWPPIFSRSHFFPLTGGYASYLSWFASSPSLGMPTLRALINTPPPHDRPNFFLFFSGAS